MRATCKEENKTEHLQCKIAPDRKEKFYQICRGELKQNPCEILRVLVEEFINKKQANN